MKKLIKKDADQYLYQGKLSQIICDKNNLLQEINEILTKNNLENTDKNKIICLNEYLLNKLHFTKNQEFARNNKFSRSAKEIWDSGKMTGCTDCALVFSTLAREIGIPTTFLATAAENWVERFRTGDDYRMHYGHAFCECFCDGEWILVDPTFNKITQYYDANKIILNYKIMDSDTFIPYFRNLDTEKRQTIQDYNKQMEDEISKIM